MNTAMRAMAERFLSQQDSLEVQRAYEDAFESHDAPLVLVTISGTVRYLNQAALIHTRTRRTEDVIGHPVEDAGLPWHAGNASMGERLLQDESTLVFEVGGRSFVCEVEVLRDKLNEPIGYLEHVRDEGDWVQSAGIDPLTGIATKERFFSETRHLLDCNPGTRYAVVYWGVIRFKLIEDVFSPATGEQVLKSIADTIRLFVGEDGTCGRFGDDSFVFCVPAHRLSVDWFKLRTQVTLMSDTAMYTFKSTFGAYEVDDLTCSVQTLCERAAFAQASVGDAYASEDDCFAFYDTTMHEGVLEEQELVSQLSYALASDEICVYYQPIYDIASGRIASAEALARWERPGEALVFPGRFIPLFESNGMITELDQHIWSKVGVFLRNRLREAKRVVPVSINVSRVDFFATTLMDDVDDIVRANDLPRELLRIEVTESAYTDDPGRIIEVVDALRSRGHTLLLDDFGSGYSSLNTLKDMPIDILKLDMSFLRDFDTDERSKHVIHHIVAMAHDLGLKVVAEGVETKEQLEFLDGVGCDLAQGFLFSRPLPEAAFVELLECTPSA